MQGFNLDKSLLPNDVDLTKFIVCVRCKTVNNKNVILCKKCGKYFDSVFSEQPPECKLMYQHRSKDGVLLHVKNMSSQYIRNVLRMLVCKAIQDRASHFKKVMQKSDESTNLVEQSTALDDTLTKHWRDFTSPKFAVLFTELNSRDNESITIEDLDEFANTYLNNMVSGKKETEARISAADTVTKKKRGRPKKVKS